MARPTGVPAGAREAGPVGRGAARERAEVSPQVEPEQSGLCGDEVGGSDLLKLDDALAVVDDFVAEKLK